MIDIVHIDVLDIFYFKVINCTQTHCTQYFPKEDKEKQTPAKLKLTHAEHNPGTTLISYNP